MDGLQGRSADFQSAVSQNCILRSVRKVDTSVSVQSPADYKSAIRQIENLRYQRGSPRADRVKMLADL
jgi:hypothetical protein